MCSVNYLALLTVLRTEGQSVVGLLLACPSLSELVLVSKWTMRRDPQGSGGEPQSASDTEMQDTSPLAVKASTARRYGAITDQRQLMQNAVHTPQSSIPSSARSPYYRVPRGAIGNGTDLRSPLNSHPYVEHQAHTLHALQCSMLILMVSVHCRASGDSICAT